MEKKSLLSIASLKNPRFSGGDEDSAPFGKTGCAPAGAAAGRYYPALAGGASFFIPLLLSLFYAPAVYAVCPICAVAVGAGLGLSRWLGIDDSVSGLWIGALIVIFIVWTIAWMDKRNLRFRFRNFAVIAGWYLLVIVPFYYAKIIAHPVDFLCSCAKDKLILGIASGGAAFYFGSVLYDYLKEKNNGHAHFPFQKVVMPIIPLVILTLIFYWLTR